MIIAKDHRELLFTRAVVKIIASSIQMCEQTKQNKTPKNNGFASGISASSYLNLPITSGVCTMNVLIFQKET